MWAHLWLYQDLDQTKAIMHDTIESALERGVKLDELIEKSEDLSAS
jgi:synaptobrevin family protein YKT6